MSHIIGIIQNMSYLDINGNKEYIFGEDGVKNESVNLKQPYSWRSPLIKEIASSSDVGEPISFVNEKFFKNVFEENLKKSFKFNKDK